MLEPGDVLKVTVRNKMGEESWLWELRWVEQRQSDELYVGYVPVLENGFWDYRGPQWGCAKLPLGSPKLYGVVSWDRVDLT